MATVTWLRAVDMESYLKFLILSVLNGNSILNQGALANVPELFASELLDRRKFYLRLQYLYKAQRKIAVSITKNEHL